MITSTANQQVKQVIQLNKKAKLRDERDIFVVEGSKMFGEAPKERIERAYISESYLEKNSMKQILEKVPYEVVSDAVFKAMSDTQTPQGILCLVKQYHYELKELLKRDHPLFLVLENLQDPGNLGTIMRTAEGAGVTAVIMSKGTVDLYNPKTIRATMGSVYRVPFVYVEDLRETVEKLLSLQEADMGSKGTGKIEEMEQFPRIQAEIRRVLEENACLSLKDLAVNGRDLIQLGYEGRAIGEKLNGLLSLVLDEKLPNEKDALLAFLRQAEEENT